MKLKSISVCKYYVIKPKPSLRGRLLKKFYRYPFSIFGPLPENWRNRPSLTVTHVQLERLLNRFANDAKAGHAIISSDRFNTIRR